MTAFTLLMIFSAYLLGSLSSALIMSKLYRLPDPRQAGSKNPGATNIYRLGGKLPALVVLIVDLTKGLLPIAIGQANNIAPFYLGIIAVTACLGHMYPLYHRFSGGKGVATAFGAMLAIDVMISSLVITFWLLLVKQFKLVSLATLISSIFGCILYWLFEPYWLPTMLTLTTLILFRHHGNLKRLITRQEPTINQ
jgi:glycerol-3-phosphate acyltransferase PlsY